MSRSLPDVLIEPVVRMALAEDLGRAGDVTAMACIPADARMKAGFVARKPGVLAGIDCVRLAVLAMDPQASVDLRLEDGDAFEAGAVLAVVEAEARAFLSAERTALNLVGRLSGVATLTRAYVQAVAGTKARIADTRKTTPGLRALEKHAVACGGGINHRFGLDDAILIKDNHVAVCGGVAEAVRRARAFAPHLMKVEVEVDGLDQLEAVLGLIAKLAGVELPDSVLPVAAALLIGGIAILAIERHGERFQAATEITWRVALVVGAAQVIAGVFPGTSRSAAAIFAALLAGIGNRPAATEFAFLVGIPTMFAATGYELLRYFLKGGSGEAWGDLGIAFVAATLTGFIAVRWLLGYVKSHRFTAFAWYRIVLGLVLIGLLYPGD